jgi:midasin
MIRFWWETYNIALSCQFEEATFQAHLAIGQDLLLKLLSEYSEDGGDSAQALALIKFFQKKLQHDFDSSFKLTTGLSMENLWLRFRPTPISNANKLEMLAQMEVLAKRFDALRWKISISVPELAGVMTSLVKAYELLLVSDVDGDSLIKTLNAELDALEAGTTETTVEVAPYFSTQFEALRQFKALEVQRLKRFNTQDFPDYLGPETIVLASNSTTSLMHLACATKTSKRLLSIDYIWGSGEGIKPIDDSFSTSLLNRLHSASDVDLKSLRLLEAEMPILGYTIVQATHSLTRNHVTDMNNVLLELIAGVVEAHGADVSIDVKANFEILRAGMSSMAASDEAAKRASILSWARQIGDPAHLQKILEGHFTEALICVGKASYHRENEIFHSALAWIHFAIGCLTLYVPDRSYDPDKRQRLERQQHITFKAVLQGKLEALRQFEKLLTGQDSNLRCQMLEEEISQLGEPAKTMQEIYRPAVSELDQLQGEFNNLLTTILKSRPDELVAGSLASDSQDSTQGLKLLQNNISQIIRRFSERFRAYSDMTVPLVSMLHCLQIGLSMAGVALKDKSNNASSILQLSKMTPFLGGQGPEHEPDYTIQPLEVLAQVSTVANIEGLCAFDDSRRQSLFEVFQTCYEQWSKRLDADREEAEAKGGLYRFKGSAEDEEEEDEAQFNELFPAFDEENSAPVGGIVHHAARDTAIALSKLHAEIFLNQKLPVESVMSLLRQMSSRIGSLWNKDMSLAEDEKYISGGTTGAFLPGALLLLDDQLKALNADTTTASSYNFYLDANLPEARKLVELIHQIQVRFRELQNVDEIGHMQPLEDVLVSCRELLEFKHTEPIAKIITKVERVHNFMHEWQFGGWASRANGAIALYDRLTQTIVSWRRLELATWAKLFEMENNKCDDDAKSWWFVAYQVIIAAPVAISDSEEELKAYAQKLLQDLEVYFATAVQGQYAQRLQMLKQLLKHLDMLVLDVPVLSVIANAVSNFVVLYSRYEKPVTENLRKGRQGLEKAMKDVLLLASWKDTNILALRDSAKRSHHKLFKLVRKYRALLSQPMDIVLKQGLPEETDISAKGPNTITALPTVDRAALALCETHVPKWSEKSRRFLNISKTVGMMDDATQVPGTALDAPEYLESFLSNIIDSTAQLQKATPSVLTEENKVAVKHLKTRKRKLFAETLKELRTMGIQHNLATDVLAKQDSLSVVLANVQHLPASNIIDFQGLNYYFDQTMDFIPRARLATREYNQDLTGAEVARSAGILEGLLQVLLKQRNVLSVAVAGTERLGGLIQRSKALWSNGAYDIGLEVTSTTLERAMKWLPTILRVALNLVNIHGKLGKISVKDAQDTLTSWIEKFDIFMRRFKDLPQLPQSIITTSHLELEKDVNEALETLRFEIASVQETHAGLEAILSQIIPWTKIRSTILPPVQGRADISVLDQKLSKTCDSILVAIEKLSKSIKSLPTLTEDPSWFIANDSVLVNNIASLHSNEIASQIHDSFRILQHLDLKDKNTSQVAGAIFAVSMPIIQQYLSILQQSIHRYGELNRVTCKMTYILAKIFAQIASQGFCTPSEKSDSQEGKTDKLEGGTGLGDGEGVEDISKDIQDDEDLSELAQEPNKEENGDMEDEKDAVDMADGEMEGEMGEAEEKGEDEEGSGDEEEDNEEMDEEAGDVDDLDPNAVDEKMWDGDGEQAEKDQEGDESKGKASRDEQVAAQENDKQAPEGDDGEEEEEEEEAGAEQSEEMTQQDDVEKHDPHAQDGENLELPDDMDLDGGDEQEGSVDDEDDNMDDMEDIEGDTKETDEVDESNDKNADGEDAEPQEDQDMGDNLDVIDLDEEDEENPGEDTEEAGEKDEGEDADNDIEEEEGLLRDHDDDAMADPDNAVPSEAQGTGEDQEDNKTDNKESSSKSQREDGGQGGESSEQKDAAAEDGEKGRQASGDTPQDQNEETQDATEAQPFKKLGDALEKWHRQQTKIRDAPEQQEKGQDQAKEMDGDNQEFQHLQDDEAEEDTTQALGTATEDQAHTLDESMAIDSESKDMPEAFQPDEAEQDDNHEDAMDIEDDHAAEPEASDAYEGRAGAMIRQANEEREPEQHNSRAQPQDIEEEVEEVDHQLEETHINETTTTLSRSTASSRQLWTEYESSTRDLSLSLTEQLRLILAPTLATKMRGDFRTGKRLNIKRIIPYIASSFKRDKIWMRRSVPSKRTYQIMLAVDDSKSMGESGSGTLAFETLAMVSQSLSMLEVGEICVVGFGENVTVAHAFDAPFAADAGPKVFQNFAFDQQRTDVTRLVRESINLFRTARAKAAAAPADLWQLELIISDGVCDSSEHEPIRRLLREALEERIMMVFIIVDDVKTKKKGESVMDLKEARFVKDEGTGRSEVRIERYLDTFPFQYYLVVSDVRELPGVLAQLLRQWFSEVADASG